MKIMSIHSLHIHVIHIYNTTNQFMVKTFLGLREVPKPDDAADALAIAICHTHYYQTKMRSLKR